MTAWEGWLEENEVEELKRLSQQHVAIGDILLSMLPSSRRINLTPVSFANSEQERNSGRNTEHLRVR